MSDKAKNILLKDKARQKIFQGIHKTTEIIRKTIGPNDSSCPIELIDNFSKESITKDSFEKIGVELVKQMAYQIKESSNDGVATAIIILDTLIKEGIKLMNANIDPLVIKEELDFALKKITEKMDSIANVISSTDGILKVLNSCKNNNLISKTIMDCFKKIGRNGAVIVEKTNNPKTQIEILNGSEFEMGYSSAYFCTNKDKISVELGICKVLLLNQNIKSTQEILPILKQLTSTDKTLLIIAQDIQADVLSTLAINKLKGTLKVAVIKAPFDKKNEIFKSISDLTGAEIVNKLCHSTNSVLGLAEKVIVTKHKTVIVANTKDKRFEKKVALININKNNNNELQEYERSLSFIKNVLEEGYLAGGCTALVFAFDDQIKSDLRIIKQLLEKALSAPCMQIISNAALDPNPILEQIKSARYPYGFNVMNQKIEDFYKTNIIDSAKVIKKSLSYAISTACSILLIDAIIVEYED